MPDINVIVSSPASRNVTLGNPQKNVIIGTPDVTFQPLDYRQGIVDLSSGDSSLSFYFSTPFVTMPVFGGELVYNGTSENDGYVYHVYNLNRSGCNVSLSEEIHTTGYQFHYYATAS